MPGYAVSSCPVMPTLFSVQEKHLRDPLEPSAKEQVAEAVALGQPCSKKPRVVSRPQMHRRILLDVMETPDVFEVKADMPGVDKQNIKIDIDKGVLTLSVSPSQHSSGSKNGPAAKACCATKHACSRGADQIVAAAALLAAEHAVTEAHDTVGTTNTQQGRCPCGEKCSCNPCRCTSRAVQAAEQTAMEIDATVSNHTQHGKCPCGDKCSCNPCRCATRAPAAEDQTALEIDAAVNKEMQHSQCPCGDKCACNPCRCAPSKAGEAGRGMSRSDAEHLNGASNSSPPNAVTRSAPDSGIVARPTEVEAACKGGSLTARSNATWHVAERTRRFQRRAIRIPETADITNVSASYTDGVLTVSLPKVAAPSTRITVAVS